MPYELVAGQLAPLVAGARIVYAGALLPNRLIEALRTRAITRLLCVPALLEVLAREVVIGLADDGAIEPACCELTAGELVTALRRQVPSRQAEIGDAVRRLHRSDAPKCGRGRRRALKGLAQISWRPCGSALTSAMD